MIKSKNLFLKEIAVSPELSDNTLALVFALNPNIDISKREKYFENVLPFFLRYKEDKTNLQLLKNQKVVSSSIEETWRDKDLRIKKIRLKSLGGFRNSEIPYGIDFTGESSRPMSMILLGSNGAGKSSIYGAIEYCFTGEVSEAKLRNFEESSPHRFRDFLQHNNNPISDSFCEIDVVDKEISKMVFGKANIPEFIKQKANPHTHLISDWDIYMNGRLDYQSNDENSFHYLIANSMGLTELLEFERHLKKFIVYPRQVESRRISALVKNISSQKQIIESRDIAIEQKRKDLENVTDNIVDHVHDKRAETLSHLQVINQANFTFNFEYDSFFEVVKTFKQRYSEFSAQINASGLRDELQFLTLGMQLTKEFNNCPFCVSSTKSLKVIQDEVSRRIVEINYSNDSHKELYKSYTELLDRLLSISNLLNLLKSRISTELDRIQSSSDFHEVTGLNNRILISLSRYLGVPFFTELTLLNNRLGAVDAPNEYLYQFIIAHEAFIETALPELLNAISLYLEERTTHLKSIHANLQSVDLVRTNNKLLVENEIRSLQSQKNEAEKSLKESEEELQKVRVQQELFDQIRSETKDLQKIIHTRLNIEVEQAFGPIKSTVEDILAYYFKISGKNIKVEISKRPEFDIETGEVLSEIISAYVISPGVDESPISVNRYFNTFHYRLFCTIVSVSLAISSRINTSINLPLILDDVFYATDFENRNTIEEFVKSIFTLFERYTPGMPLQLILFTHDQLIFQSALNASNKNKIATMQFAKLYKQQFSKQKDDFLNLIYIFPAYLPQEVVDTILIENED